MLSGGRLALGAHQVIVANLGGRTAKVPVDVGDLTGEEILALEVSLLDGRGPCRPPMMR